MKIEWHSVIEKILKALYARSHNNDILPKIQNLVSLAKLSGFYFTEACIDLPDWVSDFYLKARYLDCKFHFIKPAQKTLHRNIFIK